MPSTENAPTTTRRRLGAQGMELMGVLWMTMKGGVALGKKPYLPWMKKGIVAALVAFTPGFLFASFVPAAGKVEPACVRRPQMGLKPQAKAVHGIKRPAPAQARPTRRFRFRTLQDQLEEI